MAKPVIKLLFKNGLDLKNFKRNVFDINRISDEFDFQESDQPDFIIFGPYGNDLPPKGSYTRIGYFCENIKPDLSVCEWAFGIPLDEEINDPRYKRIQWHGTWPESLLKPANYDPVEIAGNKKYFCNFLYSHRVPYREVFFDQLSKYKKVDSPGLSMNNMAKIDTINNGSKWQRKREFLSNYKFTIAFENDIYPGYQTEKLYDAMQANSIPIYCGDPLIGNIFNTASFINATDYLPLRNTWLNTKLNKLGQMDFEDIRPSHLTGFKQRAKRKLKTITRTFNQRLNFSSIDFNPVIEMIIALDTQPDLYRQYLNQPWFKNNIIPDRTLTKNRWMEIFNNRK